MTESEHIKEIDNMGREKFWEDLGRVENDGLAMKIFKEECCESCTCKSEDTKKGVLGAGNLKKH